MIDLPLTVDLDELATLTGRRLGPTGWHDVTQADVDVFASLTRQQRWIHGDLEAAAAGPFAGTIAPATMVVAMLPGFAADLLLVRDAPVVLVHALDDVRFPATVPVGTALRATAEVLAVTDVIGGRAVVLDLQVERDAGVEPVGLARMTLRHYR